MTVEDEHHAITNEGPIPVVPAQPSPTMLLDQPRTHVVLVRHAEQVEPEPAAPLVEDYDSPLSDLGRRQAWCVADRLAAEPFDDVYTSALSRARDTAAAICGRRRDRQPVIVPELNEIEVYGGLPPDIPAADVLDAAVLGPALEAFRRSRRWDALPYTESSRTLRQRAVDAIRGIAEKHAGRRVCVVAHGGLINASLAGVLATDADMFFQPAHASVARLFHWQDTWVLHSLNDIAHLELDAACPVMY